MFGAVRCLLVLAACGWAQISPATAQGGPATDNELYAGYCLGATQAEPTVMQKLFGSPQNATQAEMMNQVIRESQRLRQRFAGYLLARGIIISPNRNDAFFGIVLAQPRGEADAMECGKQIQRCIPNRNPDACIEQPEVKAVCGQVGRCKGPDTLPY